MANPTSTSPLFLKSAQETAERLARVGGPAAQALAEEAYALADLFRGWGSQRPADAVRVAAISRLFDVNRRAMDFLSRAVPPPPSSRRHDDDDDDGDLLDAAISRRRC